MPMTKDQILAEAMALDADEREALAEELWLSLNGGRQEAVDAASLEEVRRRDAAFAAGQIQASDLDDVMVRLLARGRRSTIMRRRGRVWGPNSPPSSAAPSIAS
jgi:putative addiction module component (TIGR02574 family)